MKLLRQLLLGLLLTGCGLHDYSIPACVSESLLDQRFGRLIESIFAGAVSFDPDDYPEVHSIAHGRRILTGERKSRGIESGHIRDPSHRPVHGDEYEYALPGETLFEFHRAPGFVDRTYFRGQGPGNRLYGTGIMRGWQRIDGRVYELLMYKSYRKLGAETFERVELIVSYPELLESIGCKLWGVPPPLRALAGRMLGQGNGASARAP